MRKTVALTVSLSVLALAQPAEASISSRIRSLERRMNAVARLLIRQDITYADAAMNHNPADGRFLDGTATCPSGFNATGGGVQFIGLIRGGDSIISSYPVTGGWQAKAYSPTGDNAIVHAVCIRI